MIISSRPEEIDTALSLEKLTEDEIKLISALLYTVRLGHNISPFRDAAFTLITKIDDIYGSDFMEQASEDVDFKICVMDGSGNIEQTVSHTFVEIEV